MSQSQSIFGFKVFNPDFTCLKHQFEVGKEYTIEGSPVLCERGFHFCEFAGDCFNYYSFDSNNIVCEVEALGEIATKEGENKMCTNHIHIVRRLTWEEVLKVASHGSGNTGHSNTGDWNTGNRNTGDWNTGDWNTGNRNTGYGNTGDWNTGNRNTGDWNTGNRNTGNRNTGNRNTGNRNTGDWNTGNRNTGNRNTGNRNTGNRNTGDWNTGNRNTGDWNTGNRNTGDWNTGNRNTGYGNTGDGNTGFMCTGVETIPLFNKQSNWTYEDLTSSRAFSLMGSLETKLWIPAHLMTDEEKEKFPSYKTSEGCLRDIPFKEAFTNAWSNWGKESKDAFLKLPNFDAEIFESITGVKVN